MTTKDIGGFDHMGKPVPVDRIAIAVANYIGHPLSKHGTIAPEIHLPVRHHPPIPALGALARTSPNPKSP